MSLAYAHEEVPPKSVVVVAALQQMSVAAPTLFYPLIVAELAGLSARETDAYLGLTMLALGASCLLQASRRFGSGFLVTASCTSSYLAPLLIAARTGGIGAVAAMTIMAGLTEVVLSWVVRHLRPWFPTEVMGLVILLQGMMIGLLGFREMTGAGAAVELRPSDWAGAAATLFMVVSGSVWGEARLRAVLPIIAVTVGTAVTFALRYRFNEPFPQLDFGSVWQTGWPLAIPSFDARWLPGMALGAMVSLLRTTGDVVICQRVNNPRWRRVDYTTVRGGVLADGLGTLLGGLLGTGPVNTSSAGVGLAAASGIQSRRVCQATGLAWIALGLVPGGADMIMALPRAVLGAMFLYTGSFVLITGMGIITARLLDARRTFTIGAAFVVGLSYDLMPASYARLPAIMQSLVPSSLLLALILALLLNAVFRIGSGQAAVMAWRPDDGTEPLSAFINDAAGRWGARVEPIQAASRVLTEFSEAAEVLVLLGDSVEVSARFNELSLDVALRWNGAAMPQPRPPRLEDADDNLMVALIAANLIHHEADRVTRSVTRDGRNELSVHFDH